MNIGEYITIAAFTFSIIGGAGTGAKYYADHTYVTVASTQLNRLYDIQIQIDQLEYQRENGTISEGDMRTLKILKTQEAQIKADLGIK